MPAAWLALLWLLPLAGAVVNGLIALTWRSGTAPASPSQRLLVSVLGVGLPAASAAIAWGFLVQLLRLPPADRLLQLDLGPWLRAGGLDVHWAFMLDPLSITMVLVVTSIGALIHLYSVGYMAEDPGFARYFSYLNLFLASMLVLVMARNLVVLFIGWEGVGLCSYLLIGFWFDDAAKATAGFKAFLVNRIGDFGFLLGMFLLWWTLRPVGLQTFNLIKIPGSLAGMSAGVATAIALLWFLGAVGKSAQIPLHVWLPDAMAGPTPVSALIHAATMVTAGVYMVCRLHAVFELSGVAMPIVGAIGGATALMAATVACAQTNIKRVIAWSTISQLGYMFMALAAGAYSAGVFHLLTHAFFKGLFFLSAGAVIHALRGEENLSQMGGLWPKLKWTAIAFTIAALANAGLVPFSGFVSKDAILGAAAARHFWVLAGVGWLTALLTAFYSVRLVMLVFAGKPRDPSLLEHAHEPPWTMGVPLALLSVGAVVVGGLNWPASLGGTEVFSQFLAPLLGSGPVASAAQSLEGMGITTLLVLLGIALAWSKYRKPEPTLGSPWRPLDELWGVFTRKWYFDELYGAVVVQPTLWLAHGIFVAVDALLDMATSGIALLYSLLCGGVQRIQSGLARGYGYAMILGTLALLALAVVAGVPR